MAADKPRAAYDEAWLSAYYQENYQMLRSIGRLFVGASPEHLDIVDDQIQEIFERLWKKRDALRDHPNLDGWLVEALRRQLRGYFSRQARKAKRFSLHYYDDPDETLEAPQQATYPSPAEALEGQERYALLKSVLGSENTRIFYAYCVENESARTLARRYGCSESCIWTRISRSKQKILARSDLFFALMVAFVLHL